ncbi:GDP-mannose-dependent alpha-(1-2)-phosphatidylinositol mannosyltransferase [Lacipirellula limnantheis]|uniref:GDP-mannose-dependent alpha-(1-2)-phosphatidylinositol mannosyltransferase n=2 Tax=Lacipirellula limnantheis TaxID=2528024 RepID=A0A517TVI7_9BACT|nr:GDP-mannose-dependent alpha-(1-2)-phosphatidylinositol mannosyltransferase [Lacipirellula limnantheis]
MVWLSQAVPSLAQVPPAMSDVSPVVSLPFPGVVHDEAEFRRRTNAHVVKSSPPQLVRVLHVINGEHFSGAERVQDLLAGYLPAWGYDVGFACVKPGRFPAARTFRAAPLYELPMQSRLDFTCGRKLAALVRDEQYSIIHAHTPRSLLVADQAARLAKVPLVYHVHSPAGRDSTRWFRNMANAWLERHAAHRAARLIAVSPSVRRYMIEQGFLASHVICVPNGVPTADVQPRTAAPQTWTLGMSALFRPRKGIEVLLEALKLVRRAGSDVRLRAIGPFENAAYEGEVRALVSRLGIGDAIEWTGFVTDISAELAKVDALVLPSLFGEGLPMVVLEAMAAGLPVIASDVEGVPDAVIDREDGLLVQPGDAASLAAAIEELTSGVLDYASLSRNAQRRHAERFSAEAMARNVAAVYDQVLGR